jgi:hypothetical protein
MTIGIRFSPTVSCLPGVRRSSTESGSEVVTVVGPTVEVVPSGSVANAQRPHCW